MSISSVWPGHRNIQTTQQWTSFDGGWRKTFGIIFQQQKCKQKTTIAFICAPLLITFSCSRVWKYGDEPYSFSDWPVTKTGLLWIEKVKDPNQASSPYVPTLTILSVIN